MRISAKTDYALRALIRLAQDWEESISSEDIAATQQIPHKYLEAILSELRRTGFITSLRGPGGGHRLRRPPSQIVVADVIRALNGPLTTVRGECPEDVSYDSPAQSLQLLWIALRVSLRNILENVTLEELATGALPADVLELTKSPDAWESHWFMPGGVPAARTAVEI